MNRRDAVFVSAAAVVMRALAWVQLSRTPFFDAPVVDASTFDLWARALAAGERFVGAAGVYFKPPFYPYLLSGVYRVFGPGTVPMYVLQSLAGVAVCLLVAILARRVYGRGVGLGAGIATALLPILPFFELQLLAEIWTILLTLVALERALPADGEASARRLAVAGLLLGVGALGRPNLMLLIAAMAGWAAWDGAAHRPQRLARGAVVLAAAALVILPVTVRNASVGDEFVLVSANLGANLHTGNSDGADGLSAVPVGLRWDDLQLACRQAGHAGITQASRHLTGEALGWLTDNPGRGLELLGRRLLALVTGWEPRNNIGPAWLAREHGVTMLARWWPGTWLLLPFAILGLVFAVRRPGAGLLLTVVAIQAASLLPFFVNARFRLPIIPLLAIFAAAGCAEAIRRFRAAGPRGAAPLLAVLIAAAVVVNVDWLDLDDPRWNAEDAFNEALILQKDPRPDLQAVDALLHRAVDLDPGFPDAHERLGVLGLMRGQNGLALVRQAAAAGDVDRARATAARTHAALDEARRRHGTALRLVPRSYRSLANLGVADLLAGEVEAALAGASLASGDTAAAAEAVARARAAYAAADENLGRALRLEPTFREARDNRQALAGAMNRLPSVDDRTGGPRSNPGGPR